MISKKDAVIIGDRCYTPECLAEIAEAKKRVGIDSVNNRIINMYGEIRELRDEQASMIRWANEKEANADIMARRILQTRYGDDFIHKYGLDYIDEYEATQRGLARLKQELKECHGIGEAYKEDSLVIQSSRGLHEYHDKRATISSQEQKLQSLEKYYQEYLNEVSKLKQEALESKKEAEQIGNKIKALENEISVKEKEVAQERKEVEDIYTLIHSFYS